MDLFHSQDYWRSSLKKCDRWMLSSDRLERCAWAQAEDLFRLTAQQIHNPFCLNLTNLPHTGLMYFKALFFSLCLFIQFLFACRKPRWLRKYVKHCSLHKGRISRVCASDRDRKGEFVPTSVFALEHCNIFVKFCDRLELNIGEM